jgi:hypothetical protein
VYQVGQLLYLLFTAKQRILPARIAEELTKKTLTGESTKYTVEIPGKAELIDLDSIAAEIYTDGEHLKGDLLDRASQAITKMINTADEVSEKTFGDFLNSTDLVKNFPTPPTVSSIPPPKEVGTDAKIKVDLGNGKTANLKLPPGL